MSAVGAAIAVAAASAITKKVVEEGGQKWDEWQQKKKTEEMLQPGYEPHKQAPCRICVKGRSVG